MFEAMRKTFGPAIVGTIIGAIALVFVFYGVFSPKNQGRGGGASYAAKVNGELISLVDFEREYRARMEYFEQMFKGKGGDLEILKKLGIRKQVVDELVSRKLITQAAKKMGFVISDAEVREKIQEMPYFKKKDDKGVERFDAATYKQILEANRRSAPEFEELIREDAMRAKVMDYMQGIAKASESEIRDEFQVTEDKRQVQYVFIDRAALRDRLVVTEKEIADFTGKKENITQARQYYEQMKYEYRKPSKKKEKKTAKADLKKPELPEAPEYYPFEEVQKKVVTNLLRDRRTQDLTKMAKDLSDEIFAKTQNAGFAEFKSVAKAKGFEVKTSDKFNRNEDHFNGVGATEQLVADAFKTDSPLAKGSKLYPSGVNFIIARELKAFTPNEADFAKQKETLAKSISSRKSQQSYGDWMDELKKKADISISDYIAKAESAEAVGE